MKSARDGELTASSPRRRPQVSRQAGFTLLELIVVIVIMAVSVAVAAPSIRSGWQQGAVRRSVRQFISSAHGASSLAIRTREATALAVYPDQGEFGLAAGKRSRLPDFAEFGEIVGGRDDRGGEDGADRILFQFHPMGSADGGSIELRFRTSGGIQSYTLIINSLLGTIAIRENQT